SYIWEARLKRGSPSTLELLIVVPPRPRMPTEEQWVIPVPPEWEEHVEEILPLLAPYQESQEVE
ncbi:MAG: hypothetical protein JXA78_04230, partial [Anaerolineales bacterium]|nr:hypothetical protein [Anaerolineales bacterium]